MILIGKPQGWRSASQLLILDQEPIGKFQNHWTSPVLDIRLTQKRLWKLQQGSLRAPRFMLTDATGKMLAWGMAKGLLSARWKLQLDCGAVEMVSRGAFQSGFDVRAQGEVIARVGRSLAFTGGWQVMTTRDLTLQDLLFIGLTYQRFHARKENRELSPVWTAGTLLGFGGCP